MFRKEAKSASFSLQDFLASFQFNNDSCSSRQEFPARAHPARQPLSPETQKPTATLQRQWHGQRPENRQG